MIKASSILSGTDFVIEPKYQKRLDVLLETCRKNLPSVDEEMINRAFRLSYWAHRNDTRVSGESYISHPLEVAQILAEKVAFDDVSIAAALLHDVVEDTDLSLDLIRDEFGDTLAVIIDGLTKIEDVFSTRELGQAENVRKLMLSMATDIRVILVKFADRLHNMRTISSLAKHKQLKIASETLDLFAPLAHRFGLFSVKSELQDLCLEVLHPEEYAAIVRGLRDNKEQREAFIRAFIGPVKERLEKDGFKFEIAGRSKNAFSIFEKMRRQNKPLEDIYDVFAIRVVLLSEDAKGREDCWRVYSIITDLYKPLPERFRDFVSVPKSNGYQSLHTTVLGPQGKRVEVQIRTQQMHQIAEQGVAAHWKYKEDVSHADNRMEDFLSWVRELLDSPRQEAATDFVSEFRLNLFSEEIYVFTPRGDLMTLPTNATPIDFAFQVHTEIGYHCIGAKVNGKMVPLSYRLHSGDQVEVITSKKQTPNPDWMNFVVTHKARSRIRNWINEKRNKSYELGLEIWKKRLKKAGISPDDRELTQAASKLKYSSRQQMFFEIGVGLLDPTELVNALNSSSESGSDEESAESKRIQAQYESFLSTAHESGQPALMIDGELHTDITTRYATCCNPIPGDDVFGFVSRTGSISIHRVSCRNSPNLLINQPDRIVPVEWSRQKDVQFVTALRIVGEDRVGMISDVTTLISKNLKTNIRSITVDTEDGIFEGTIVLYVADLRHLQRIIARIHRVQGVHGVYRFEERFEEN